MNILLIAIAPVVIILSYVYYRDKYEKEPVQLLMKGLIFGMISVIPILALEHLMDYVGGFFEGGKVFAAFYRAFFVAALCEESMKMLFVWILIWRNPNFNEKFDGIVYAVFVSLGFALVENLMYVLGSDNSLQVGIIRALTAVPAHAMFGVLMGYYFGLSKFYPHKRLLFGAMAFVMPFLCHGYYDFVLMSELPLLLLTFVPFLIWMFVRTKKQMKELSDASIFRGASER